MTNEVPKVMTKCVFLWVLKLWCNEDITRCLHFEWTECDVTDGVDTGCLLVDIASLTESKTIFFTQGEVCIFSVV